MRNQGRHIFVLGAGPVGLVSAWEFLKRGESVTIFEAQDRVGGMCRTWHWGDFLVDAGPHIFHTPEESLAEYWEQHFGDLFVQGDFWCQNVSGKNFDEYWDYPISWESISKYDQPLRKKILSEAAETKSGFGSTATNYSEYIRAQVGVTLEKMFFKTYPEKVWGIPTTEMTPEWAPKRIEFRNHITPFYHGQWNAVGKYGTGCVYQRIEEKITELGGEIKFDHKVTGIEYTEWSLEKIMFSSGASVSLSANDIVVSSLPITVLAKLLGYTSDLSFRGIKSVYLAYDQKQIIPGRNQWLYYGSEEILFNRITEPKKLSPFVSPPDKTYLTVETTFSSGDNTDQMPDQDLVDVIANQVEAVGLANSREIVDTSINTERFVYPLLHKGYEEELSNTRAAITRFQQLYSIGTGGDYNYADSQVLFHKAFDLVDVVSGKGSGLTQTVRRTPVIQLNRTVNLESSVIGDGYRAYIVAEAGLNHNGDLKLAKQLVDSALAVGCDAIKFQTFSKNSRISSKVKGVKYAETVIGLEETLHEMFSRLAMPFAEQQELFDYAREKRIEIFSTPFDSESVEFLESVDTRFYKIASVDLVNLPLIKQVAATGKPILLSTGMATLGQIEEAVDEVRNQGNPNLILLHCNSSYPSALREMNLSVIRNLKRIFGVPVGLSDHTFGLFAAHTAISIGANVVERHFTLDRSFEGPDHILSSEPDQFAELVAIAKNIPEVLGDGLKRIQPNEYFTLNMQRKSIYAAVDIKQGMTVTKEMLAIKGPGGGLLPRYFDVLVGRRALVDIGRDEPITWENI